MIRRRGVFSIYHVCKRVIWKAFANTIKIVGIGLCKQNDTETACT